MNTRVLSPVQIVAATLAVCEGIAYGKAKDAADQGDSKEAKEAEGMRSSSTSYEALDASGRPEAQ